MIRGSCRAAILLVAALGVTPIATAQPDSLCARLDSNSRRDEIEEPPYPMPLGYYAYPEGAQSALPTLFSQLKDPDPRLRIEAVARLGLLRKQFQLSGGAPDVRQAIDERFLNLLQQETHAQVVEQVLLFGCLRTNWKLAPFLVEAFSCEGDEGLRSAALRCATEQPGLLQLAGQTGNPDATSLFKAAFERVDKGHQRWVADFIIRAQFEPNKPLWTDEDRRRCVF